MSDQQVEKKTVTVIRHRGSPNQATTLHGERVERKAMLWIPDQLAFVPTAPYDDHFIYWTDHIGQSALMCTCGSPAVVKTDPPVMAVCLFHATEGVHATGGTRWV